MGSEPGADELQIRDLLIQHGVGPDAEPSAAPAEDAPEPAEEPEPRPAPPAKARRLPDWWRKKPADLTADEDDESDEEPDDEDEPETSADPDPEPADDEPDPESAPARKRRRNRPRRPHGNRPTYLVDEPRAPRQSLVDAYASVPTRIRWLIYHGTAAAAGYRLGWVRFSTDTAAWIARHGLTDKQALFWYGVTLGAVLLYRRLSPALLVVGWAATIPIASIVTGALLYGTGY